MNGTSAVFVTFGVVMLSNSGRLDVMPLKRRDVTLKRVHLLLGDHLKAVQNIIVAQVLKPR